MMSDLPLMELKDIHKSFGNVDALKGVSISIKAGECHCLLGDNGAGKSTFIKIMSGVHQPTSGQISINGQDTEINNKLTSDINSEYLLSIKNKHVFLSLIHI